MDLIEKYLGEGVSQYKKLFTTYAKEIIENIIKEHKFDSEETFKQNAKQIQSAVVAIMGTMALDEHNPNYVHKKKYMPKNFKKELFDNGGGNVYDSEWMGMNDSHQFTIARDAMMEISKEKMNNVLNRNDLIK